MATSTGQYQHGNCTLDGCTAFGVLAYASKSKASNFLRRRQSLRYTVLESKTTQRHNYDGQPCFLLFICDSNSFDGSVMIRCTMYHAPVGDADRTTVQYSTKYSSSVRMVIVGDSSLDSYDIFYG